MRFRLDLPIRLHDNPIGHLCGFQESARKSTRVVVGSCRENVVLDAGAGFDPTSAPAGGIVIHDSAAGCVCTCNHVGASPGNRPYIMGGSVHGPVARVSSGDISFARAASHHLVNTAT